MKRLLAVALLLIASISSIADISYFLRTIPQPGSWSEIEITTTKFGNSKSKTFHLSSLSTTKLSNRFYVRVEASPMNFIKRKDGILQILVPADMKETEALNPFAVTAEVVYKEPNKEPFYLSSFAMKELHRLSAKIRSTTKKQPIGTETISIGSSKINCNKEAITTITVDDLGNKKTTETGTFWTSKEIPFGIVKAETKITEEKKGQKKEKTMSLILLRYGTAGAKSEITSNPKEMGILGIFFK